MTNPIIELRGLQRTFPGPPQVRALRDATFTIAPGETVAMTGPSGSGKSTLLNQLGLLDTPTGGHYAIDGTRANDLPERRRTRLRAAVLGFVFQAAHLVSHLDVRANVTVPLAHIGVPRRQRSARAELALQAVGLDHRLRAAPATLSGGERQRVAIARAIVTRPRVLLCDEPTGNLDSENTEAVLALLTDLSREHTVVIVTHEAEVAKRCDRTISVLDGVARG
ncbi:ABC transporter ATP-binding protein [Natronoglycomyces albus]|uniref:ABC transporter ATP-binding protein n=1 Tax=Natronoglycomyces albus TaxID=2811108 RepID=A0A895XGZ3_9ACTN|nr:ABC transporter ATP-binding protein [Natronoglycomyces albus]QSB04177.1 ABC transporter ATP-binding protein [Natronoglycomyces albus]